MHSWRTNRCCGANCVGNHDVVVIDLAVAITVERGEILCRFDCARAKQIKNGTSIYTLKLTAKLQRVRAPRPTQVVTKLHAILRCLLGNPEVATILDRREAYLIFILDKGGNAVEKIIFVKDEIVENSRRESMRPGVDECVIVVERVLPVISRTDGPTKAAAIDVIFTLIRVAERHSIIPGDLPIPASC